MVPLRPTLKELEYQIVAVRRKLVNMEQEAEIMRQSARRNLQIRKRRRMKLERPAKIARQERMRGHELVWSGTKIIGRIIGG